MALLLWGCGSAVIAAPPESTHPAEPANIESTVFLIGDAGAPAPDEPVLKALKRQVLADTALRVIVFLGDNVYNRGMPDSSNLSARREAERRLQAQMAIGLDTRTPTYFVPGNHDWGYMGVDGWGSIRRQGAYVEQHGEQLVRLLPRNGCPGPEVVDVGRGTRLIMLDTQWFVHEYAKPVDSTSGCATWTAKMVAESLGRAVASLKDSVDTVVTRRAVILGHHPMDTSGEHGGYFTWVDQFFPLRRFARWLWIPLPGIGSQEAIARRGGQTNQDMAGPLYEGMRRALDEVFKDNPPLVFAGGHDHNLQVQRGVHVKWVLVSGAGIYGHLNPVGINTSTRYAAAKSGFMRLDVLRDGRVRLGVITVDAVGKDDEAFALYLE
ncbi:MAG: metallophosphoesterase [Gemmatimonadota bacterium]